MPPAAHFRLAESGQRPIKAGDFDFPRLNNPPLKNDQSGGLRAPLLDVPPERHLRHLTGAAGPLRSKAPPPGDWQESSLGEIPKMGEPQFPLFGRFKEGCRGGKSKSLPCRLFPPFRRRKGGARRAGVP